MPFESRVLRFIESSLNTPSSDFANKFIQQESSNPRVPLFKQEPTSPPKPSHITAKIRSVAAVKTEPDVIKQKESMVAWLEKKSERKNLK